MVRDVLRALGTGMTLSFRRTVNLVGICSEPRLAFNRIVVARYRSHLEYAIDAYSIKALVSGSRLAKG